MSKNNMTLIKARQNCRQQRINDGECTNTFYIQYKKAKIQIENSVTVNAIGIS